jgi:hypothetical protein
VSHAGLVPTVVRSPYLRDGYVRKAHGGTIMAVLLKFKGLVRESHMQAEVGE